MKVNHVVATSSANPQSNNTTFKGWLTYTNTQGLKKMLNTDSIQNIESKKIKYIIKDRKFTGNYIFDAVRILLNGDNRVAQNSVSKIKGTVKTKTATISIGEESICLGRTAYANPGYQHRNSAVLEESYSDSKINLDANTHSESFVHDKWDTIIINFQDFTKAFQTALTKGFGEVKSKALPKEGDIKSKFFSIANEKLPTETRCYKERKWFGMNQGFMECNAYEIINVPSVATIKKNMADLDKPLKKEYGKNIQISYDNDCPGENGAYDSFEIIIE